MLPVCLEPLSWQELQNKVAKLFSDMDFETEVEKDINLVRGTVNVDVFASRKFHNIRELIIAECKYWSKPIPQHVIHSFRTVISDSGANTGYIISKEGFQEGAYKAVENSNISILTFEEFLSEFKKRWLQAVVDRIEELGYPLIKFTDPYESFYDAGLSELSKEKKVLFATLMQRYQPAAMATFRLNYCNAITGKLEVEYIDKVIEVCSKHFPSDVQVTSLMDYFDYVKNSCIEGVNEFDSLLGRKIRKHNF